MPEQGQGSFMLQQMQGGLPAGAEVGMSGQRQGILVCEWHASLMLRGGVVFLQ